MIDTSSSPLVEISGDARTAFFRLQDIYAYDTKHYILMDRGAFVGANFTCSGGGPVTEGVLTKDAWTFTTPKCHSDVDCQANGQCDGSTCVCKAGYQQDGRISCVDVDECTKHTHDCHPDALCDNMMGSFTCTCRVGYQGPGTNCSDVDECTDGGPDCVNSGHCCHANASCANAIGSFVCTCKNGFSGDGLHICIGKCPLQSDSCLC